MPEMPVGHPIVDGKIKRYGPGKKAWYVLHEVRLRNGRSVITGAYAVFGLFDKKTIRADEQGLSLIELGELDRKMREANAAEERKRRQLADNAANRARIQWDEALASGVSEYVTRKQIEPFGARYQDDGTLIVPAYSDTAGSGSKLVGLQKIAPNGEKRFNKGMEKRGAFFSIGLAGEADSVDPLVIAICEGYATGCSIRMAMPTLPVVIAYDAGNLMPVTHVLSERYPSSKLLICGDDDRHILRRITKHLFDQYRVMMTVAEECEHVPTTGGSGLEYRISVTRQRDQNKVVYYELKVDTDGWPAPRITRFENAGRAKAAAIASAVPGAHCAFPVFADDDCDGTDWNDLHCAEGMVRVREQLSAATLLCASASGYCEAAIVEPSAAQVAAPAPADDGVKHHAKPSSRVKEVPDSVRIGPDPGEGEPAGDDVNWEIDLQRTDKGHVLPSLSNVYTILTRHKEWAGVIANDTFSNQTIKRRLPPFRGAELGEWSDLDDLRTTLWLAQRYGIQPRADIMLGAIQLVAADNNFHVVREYLEPLRWDGVNRLDRWLIDWLGAEDIPYHSLAGRKWMIGAVARVFDPGCKMDNVLILEGAQGLRKSTALKVMGGDWFTDAPFRFGDKDAFVTIRGKWIVELAELDSFNKADSDAAKVFFGQYVDRYRNFYGRRAMDVPRQQIFAGSVNGTGYLKDSTGNRRYWPALCTRIDIDALIENRDQLWAEAVHRYRNKEVWWPSDDERPLFVEQQDARYVGDALIERIRPWLNGRVEVSMSELLGDCLSLDTSKWSKPEQQRVGKCMAELEWDRVRKSTGKREWVYRRPGSVVVPDPQTEAEEGPF